MVDRCTGTTRQCRHSFGTLRASILPIWRTQVANPNSSHDNLTHNLAEKSQQVSLSFKDETGARVSHCIGAMSRIWFASDNFSIPWLMHDHSAFKEVQIKEVDRPAEG